MEQQQKNVVLSRKHYSNSFFKVEMLVFLVIRSKINLTFKENCSLSLQMVVVVGLQTELEKTYEVGSL